MNRDVSGKSLSVVVRLYQLKSAHEFSKLTFDAVADGRPESELLGPALIDKTDVVIVPGGSYSSTEKLNDEVKFLGVVAFFRKPDQYYWRQLVDADVARSEGVNFRVQDCYLVLNGVKAVLIPGQPVNAKPDCGAAPAPTPARQNARGAQTQRNLPAQQQYPQQRAYPQQGYQQQYPQPGYQQAPANSGKPGMPDVNVSVNTPFAPTNVRVGSGGVSSVSVGSQAPQQAPAQPYPAQQAYPYSN